MKGFCNINDVDIYFFSRKNNTLIVNTKDGQEIPIIKFKQSFIDLIVVEKEPLAYMERYIEMFPNLCEKINEPPKENQQLTFF